MDTYFTAFIFTIKHAKPGKRQVEEFIKSYRQIE